MEIGGRESLRKEICFRNGFALSRALAGSKKHLCKCPRGGERGPCIYLSLCLGIQKTGTRLGSYRNEFKKEASSQGLPGQEGGGERAPY